MNFFKYYDKYRNEIELLEAAQLMEDSEYRTIGSDKLFGGRIWISTVWLGVTDISGNFESMFFLHIPYPNGQYRSAEIQWRYDNLSEALEGHSSLVAQARSPFSLVSLLFQLYSRMYSVSLLGWLRENRPWFQSRWKIYQGKAIKCPQCRRGSYNQNDVKKQYCGNCHQFHQEMPTQRLRQPIGEKAREVLFQKLLSAL